MLSTKIKTILAAFFVSILLTGCNNAIIHSNKGAGTIARLTAGSTTGGHVPAFRAARYGNRVNIASPVENLDINQRSMLIFDGTPSTMNQFQCIEWNRESSPVNQPGVVLRARKIGQNSWSAITITKNVWGGATWQFNVHEWNNQGALFGLSNHHTIGSFNMWNSVGWARNNDATIAAPWNLCGAIMGNKLFVKAWVHGTPEPTYLDPIQAGNLRLPSRLNRPGQTGVYAGHLLSGDWIAYSRVWPIPAQ